MRRDFVEANFLRDAVNHSMHYAFMTTVTYSWLYACVCLVDSKNSFTIIFLSVDHQTNESRLISKSYIISTYDIRSVFLSLRCSNHYFTFLQQFRFRYSSCPTGDVLNSFFYVLNAKSLVKKKWSNLRYGEPAIEYRCACRPTVLTWTKCEITHLLLRRSLAIKVSLPNHLWSSTTYCTCAKPKLRFLSQHRCWGICFLKRGLTKNSSIQWNTSIEIAMIFSLF